MVSKMKPRVHLETTVISYLTALPSRDIVQAAHQQQTRDWWAHRSRFELYASQAVVVEASRGDAAAAALRLAALAGVGLLEVNAEAEELAARLLGARVVPRKAAVDALHVAIAVVHGMHYLVTWNCAHIANAAIRGRIELECREAGFEPPAICTPEELMGDSDEW
jgi:hypothetical protein